LIPILTKIIDQQDIEVKKFALFTKAKWRYIIPQGFLLLITWIRLLDVFRARINFGGGAVVHALWFFERNIGAFQCFNHKRENQKHHRMKLRAIWGSGTFRLQRKRLAFLQLHFTMIWWYNFSFIARGFRAGYPSLNIILFVLFWFYMAQKYEL
jgi:hypothetical protein